jgi:hypothetical protein
VGAIDVDRQVVPVAIRVEEAPIARTPTDHASSTPSDGFSHDAARRAAGDPNAAPATSASGTAISAAYLEPYEWPPHHAEGGKA